MLLVERTEKMNQRLKAAAVLLVIALQIPLPAFAQQAAASAPCQRKRRRHIRRSRKLRLRSVSRAAPVPPAAARAPISAPYLKLAPDYSSGKRWFPSVAAPYTPYQVPPVSQQFAAHRSTHSEWQADAQSGRRHLAGPRKQHGHCRAALHSLARRSEPSPLALRREWPACFRSRSHRHRVHRASVSADEQSVSRGRRRPELQTTRQSRWRRIWSRTTDRRNFNYTQGFSPGTQLQVTFNNNRSSINFPANLFNPFRESTLTVQVTQPLLNGFGNVANTSLHHRSAQHRESRRIAVRAAGHQHRHASLQRLLGAGFRARKRESGASHRRRRPDSFTKTTKSSSKSAPWLPWT